MKVFNLEQGSRGWLQCRLGIPTASQFHKIITPAKLDFSKQARAYAFRLVAEKLLNESLDTIDYIDHVQRGKDLEGWAVKMFEMAEDVQTAPAGFITTDDMKAGASPDRLIVGKPAGLECKCPSAWVHIEYLVDGFGNEYIIQAQGQNYVCEFDYVARYSFHPSLPPVQKQTYRDEMVIAKLMAGLDQFYDVRDEIKAKVRASGFIEDRANLRTEYDRMAAELGASDV